MGEKWEKRRKGSRVLASAGLIADTNGKFVDPNLGKTEDAEKKGKYGFVRETVDAFKSKCFIFLFCFSFLSALRYGTFSFVGRLSYLIVLFGKLTVFCPRSFDLLVPTVNVLVVIGHEKLHMEMQRMFGGPNSRIKIVKIPKSAGVRLFFSFFFLSKDKGVILSQSSMQETFLQKLGSFEIHPLWQVVDLDRAHRIRSQALQIKSYFYGDPPSLPSISALSGVTAMNPLALSPHSTTVRFEDLSIWRVGEGSILF